MDEKSIWIIPLTGEKEKWRMWSGKFMARAGIKGYDILLRGNMETPVGDTDKTKDKGVTATLKMRNKRAYNEPILSQEDMVCF